MSNQYVYVFRSRYLPEITVYASSDSEAVQKAREASSYYSEFIKATLIKTITELAQPHNKEKEES